MKFELAFLFFLCYSQASPIEVDPKSTQSVLEQIEPVLENLHQRIDVVIVSIENDVEITEGQINRYIDNQKIVANQIQMAFVQELIKRINEINNNPSRKDCISGQKDLVESLQRTSFQDIDSCQISGLDVIKSFSKRKYEIKDQSYKIKTEIGNIIGSCIKFDGFDSLLSDCLKVQTEKLKDRITFLENDFQRLQSETSQIVTNIFDKLVNCNDYVKRQSAVEGNLIIEKVTQCVHS